MDVIKIGKTIKELRLSKGLSQAEVAKVCNITAPAVSKWERGESIPDISSLESLSQLFGVSINEIVNSNAVIETIVDNRVTKYKIISIALSILIVILLSIGVIYYGDFKDYLQSSEDVENLIQEDPVLNEYILQSNKSYHLYYEATQHQFVQGSINDWIFQVFIQEPDLYNYFIEGNHPNLNFVSVDTTTLVRRNNETSYIELEWTHNDEIVVWKLDVTYYDIKSDDDFVDLNRMNHITSNNNVYEFDIFDDGYYVLYELVEGNTVYDNYYFHISDMKPIIINDDIRIDFELDKLGINIIITDHFEVDRYHYVFTDNDGGTSSWFLQTHKNVYLSFIENGSELQLVNFSNDNGTSTIFLKAYSSDTLIWEYDYTFHDYLSKTINHEDLDYIITFSLQYSGLVYVVFESKLDGHIMSYYLQPNELVNN